MKTDAPLKIALLANSDWYLYNFRLSLAKSIQATGTEVVLLSPPGPFAPRLREHGLRWVPIKLSRRGMNPLLEAMNLAAVTATLRRERPDLVHSFTIKGVVVGSTAAYLAGVPAQVNAITGLGFVFASRRWLAKALRPFVVALLRFLLRGKRTRLILQNSDDFKDLVSSGIASPETTVLIRSSGVDTQRFHPTPAPPVRRVLMATRMLWSKGVKEYVTAAALVRLHQPQVEFLMAGDVDPGNPASVPEKVIRQWRDAGIVRYLGHVDRMEQLLRDVSLVVLPTVYGEGVPRILVEAAAAGMPIIASDVPGCREICRPGVNGFLIPPGSAEALAAAISDVLSDEPRRQKMAAASRDIALDEFDERIVIGRTLDVYSAVVPGFFGSQSQGITHPA